MHGSPSHSAAFLPKLRLLVFDLDGTLIDSRQDLVRSVNATLQHLSLPQLPEAVVASYVGDGAALLVRRALGLAPPSTGSRPMPLPELTSAQAEQLEAALAWFLQDYHQHQLDCTRLYPGVAEALPALKKTHRLAVLTNKPVRNTLDILDGLGVLGLFDRVYGGDSFPHKKPDPAGLRALLEEFSSSAGETLMVGDSHVDIRTGHNAGVWTCGVTYGFAPQSLADHEPGFVVDTFPQLVEMIENAER